MLKAFAKILKGFFSVRFQKYMCNLRIAQAYQPKTTDLPREVRRKNLNLHELGVGSLFWETMEGSGAWIVAAFGTTFRSI